MRTLSLLFSVLLSIFCVACSEYKYPDTFHPNWPSSPIELKNRSGKFDFEKAQKNAKVTLIFFGFTHCPDICPTTMSTIAAAANKLNADELSRLLVIFITIDPGRDTPDVADNYAKGFHPSFVGLSGSKEEVDKVVKAYAAFASGTGDQISHSSGIYWMKQDGMIRANIRKPEENDLFHDLKLGLSKL